MRIPLVEQAERYRGLYVFDFGEWTAVGYTAEEIAVLLESEAYRGGKVYKIHQALPDGRMELRGVSTAGFDAESGMFFSRPTLAAGRADFDELVDAAEATPPPCRAYVQLAECFDRDARARFVTALIYPAEFDDTIGSWLCAIDFRGGDTAEAGISHVADFTSEEKRILARQQLWNQTTIASRSAEQVLASVHRAVQR